MNGWKGRRPVSRIDPNGMAWRLVDADGACHVRHGALKAADERGFVFYTNLESANSASLRQIRKAAICFHWKSLRRQKSRGARPRPTRVSDAEADEIRPRGPATVRSVPGPLASPRALEMRFELEREVARYGREVRFRQGAGAGGQALPHRARADVPALTARSACTTVLSSSARRLMMRGARRRPYRELGGGSRAQCAFDGGRPRMPPSPSP